MSKEKQSGNCENCNSHIDEMANDLRQAEHWEYDEDACVSVLNREKTAENLYNANYRKQSEGEWVRKDGFFVCSNCDGTKPFAVLRDEIHYFGCNYCNKCGAKMKGGEEE